MNTIEIPDIGYKAELPSHWDEMTPDQVVYCLKQAILSSLGVVDPVEAQVRCLYFVLDIERDWKTERWERIQEKSQVDEKWSRIIILSEQIFGFLFKENDRGLLEVQYDTLINYFPVLRSGKLDLYGPADLLTDLSFGEFRTAIEEMNKFFEDKSTESLDRFVACLYRPARPDLDQLKKSVEWDRVVREPFNLARLPEVAQLTHKLSTVEKRAVLLWFSFCLQFIQKQDIPIGDREINFEILFNGNGSGEGKGSGWTGVLHSIAEKQIFGTADQVDRRNVFDLLLYMYDKELENKKLKAKYKIK